jgi:sugar lactone lactonase YvrE
MRVWLAAVAVILSIAPSVQAQHKVPEAGNRRARAQKLAALAAQTAKLKPRFTSSGGAFLYEPGGLAIDTSGNLYIVSPNQSEVLILNTSGVLSVFAGNGTPGYTGDGAAATAAELNSPERVVADNLGNVYISDSGNNVIRVVNSDGVINTFAGGATTVCAGATDAFGDGCPATQATLSFPYGISIDPNGNLLIADANDALIRSVSKTTGNISLVAGGAATLCAGATDNYGDGCPATQAVFSYPEDVVADGSDNIYVDDNGADVVRKIAAASGTITLYAGDFLGGFQGDNVAATSTSLYGPSALAVDGSGNLYIADDFNGEVREVSAATQIISDVAGNVSGADVSSGDGGAATSATFSSLEGMVLDTDSGNLYVSDQSSYRVRVVAGGTINTKVSGPLAVAVNELTFDKQGLSTSGSQSLVLTNGTKAAITISSLTFGSPNETAIPFTETDNCTAAPLAAGGTCTINVTFTPTSLCDYPVTNSYGPNDAYLTIADDAPGGESFLFFLGMGADASGISVTDLTNESQSASSLANLLVGPGITLSNVSYTGAPVAAGSFTALSGTVGIGSGVILSTGSLQNVVGPNCSTAITRDNGQPGDTDLNTLIPGQRTFDAAVLQFDFVPANGTLNFQYVFSSDEYPEFVGFYDDVFGFFLNGTNVALLPGTQTAVSINTVNDGNPTDSSIPESNPQFFIDNNMQYPNTAPFDTEMDGLTVVLSVQVPVTAGTTNHLKLAIGDTGDHLVDSNVFIAAGSLNSSALNLSPATLAFGSEGVGVTTAPQTVTLKNTGTTTVTIVNMGTAVPFAMSSTTCISVLAANASCTVSVTFAPTQLGLAQGQFTITTNTGGSNIQQFVSLSGTGVSPATATVQPTSLAFGSVTDGTTSAAMSVTVTNDGGSALIFSAIGASANFAVTNAGTCAVGGAGVAVGNSCTIFVTFAPTQAIAYNGTLTITDNTTTSPQTVSLSGTGVAGAAPVVSLSATMLTFPSEPIGTASPAQTVTVTNTGNANLVFTGITPSGDFSVASSGTTCVTGGSGIAAEASCTVNVVFTPTASGTRTGSLSFADNATGSPQSVSLTGTGVAPAPVVSLSATSLTFPSEPVGTASPAQTVTVTNTGNANLVFAAITPSGDFSVASSGTTCATGGAGIAASASCNVKVVFTPTATGTRTGTLAFTDNAAGSPQSVSLTGTGVTAAPVVSLSATMLTFPSEPVGTASPAQTVTVTNTGNANLVFTAITPSGDFSVGSSGTTCVTGGSGIAASASCTVSVVFTPTATGTRTGTLSFTDNAAGSPQSVSLTGTGVTAAPVVSLSATSLTFPSEVVGTASPAQTVTVTNTGNANLFFSSIVTSGDFSVASNGTSCSTGDAEYAPQATCSVSLIFTPSAAGTRTGTLKFTDNAGNSPQSVSLTGTGVAAAPEVSLSPTSLTFAAQSIGVASAPQTVTVTNTGNADLSFYAIVASGVFSVSSSGTTCVVESGVAAPHAKAVAAAIAPQATCTIAVVFTPTEAGAASGTLTLTDNAANSPQSVPLSGTGANFLLSFGGNGLGTITVSPGNTAVAPIVLSGPEGLTGTVQLSCTSSSPTITCNLTPTSVALTGTAPINTIIEVDTYCSDAPPMGIPFGGGRGGSLRVIELLLLLGGGAFVVFAMSRGGRRRLAGGAMIAILLATTAVGCKSVPKGPSGATPPGTYTITITATLGGVSQSLNLTLVVN